VSPTVPDPDGRKPVLIRLEPKYYNLLKKRADREHRKLGPEAEFLVISALDKGE
jgi:hypothetical protein